MTGNIARRLETLEDQMHARNGRAILEVVDPNEARQDAVNRVDARCRPITEADTVHYITTGVPAKGGSV